VAQAHPDPHAARRSIEDRVAPVVQRLDRLVSAAKDRTALEPASGLEIASGLVRDADEDLHIVEALCGRESDFFPSASKSVAEAALDALVAYQRESGDDVGCLPWLFYLLEWEVTPELAERRDGIFEVIYGNAIAVEPTESGGDEAPPPEEIEARQREKIFRLMVERVIPEAETLPVEPRGRSAYFRRVADILLAVAEEAFGRVRDLDFAIQVLNTAAQLPLEPEWGLGLEEKKNTWTAQLQAEKDHALALDFEGIPLVIDRLGIQYNGVLTPNEAIVALKYADRFPNDEATGAVDDRRVVAWATPVHEWELDRENTFFEPERADEDYEKIVAALSFFVVPSLIDRLVNLIQAGEPVYLGETPLSKEGMVFSSKARLWKSEEQVPYTGLGCAAEGASLTVFSVDQPRLRQSYPFATTWNAVIADRVLARLSALL
jgi:hypothetical protein